MADGLHEAIEAGELEAVKGALAAGADPDAPDHRGARALHGAAARGELELARVLLDAGASVALRDATPFGPLTPLFLATMAGELELVELLLERGADPRVGVEARGEAEEGHEWVGWTPLHWAASEGRLELLAALLRADPHAIAATTAAGETVYQVTKDRRCRALLLTVGRGGGVDEFFASLSAGSSGRG